MMQTTAKDPLRFIKPRKKQIHLTPTKSSNNESFLQTSSSAISLSTNNQPIDGTALIQKPAQKQFKEGKDQNIPKQYAKTIKSIMEPNARLHSQRNHSSINNSNRQKIVHQDTKRSSHQNHQKAYNPTRYFSSSINQFLKGKYHSKANQEQNANNSHTAHPQNVSFDNIDQNLSILPLKETNFGQQDSQTMRVEDFFGQNTNSNRTTPTSGQPHESFDRNEPQNRQQDHHEQLKHNLFMKKQSSTNNGQNNNQYQVDDKNTKATVFQGGDYEPTALRECETCGRSFNPESFQKHIKVCEKVFFKKRKQFSSQKQRSKSNNKKTAT